MTKNLHPYSVGKETLRFSQGDSKIIGVKTSGKI